MIKIFTYLPRLSVSTNWKIDFRNSFPDIDTPSLTDSVSTYLWGVQTLSVLICIILFLLAANKISNEDYMTGFITIIGGVIAGISPFLAKIFMY
jgi:hypothetical protein